MILGKEAVATIRKHGISVCDLASLCDSHEELRQLAETAERELTVDLSYRERWQQERDQIKDLESKLAGMKQETRITGMRPNLKRQTRFAATDWVDTSVFDVEAGEWKDADQEVKRG